MKKAKQNSNSNLSFPRDTKSNKMHRFIQVRTGIKAGPWPFRNRYFK
jgi:hypothetical protein